MILLVLAYALLIRFTQLDQVLSVEHLVFLLSVLFATTAITDSVNLVKSCVCSFMLSSCISALLFKEYSALMWYNYDIVQTVKIQHTIIFLYVYSVLLLIYYASKYYRQLSQLAIDKSFRKSIGVYIVLLASTVLHYIMIQGTISEYIRNVILTCIYGNVVLFTVIGISLEYCIEFDYNLARSSIKSVGVTDEGQIKQEV